jgi:type I restriction enzyme S subunit
VLRFTDDVWPWFIVTLMSAPTSKKYLAGASVGITMQNLNQSILCGMPVGLPPTAEQRRIVVTVHELMKLCDELEAAQQKRERRRDRLVVASLHALNNSDSTTDGAQSFKESASFYFNQLPRLTIRPEHIEQLRRGIRTLAVRGKLVNQNAAEQLTRRRLGARGLRSPESPFDIPNSWAWAQVEDIGTARLGKMLDKAKNKGNLYPYLRNVNVRWFDFNLTDVFEMPFEDHELAEFQLRQGDVLICEGGEPGRAAVWDERKTGIYFQKAIHRIRLSEDVNPHFFVTVLRESADSGRLLGHFTGVGIKHLTGKGLSSLLIPLPPIEEQRRITGRVAELMANCNELETSLTRSADCRMSLLEATLHEALNSTTGDS